MGWTLLAFHSIYVSSGIEYPLSFLVPFYYYFKLLVLGATFALPALTSLNPFQKFTGETSSNPFVVGWFHYMIVPGVQRMHELTDHDPKRWAIDQLTILPFLLLDFFILPGVLLSDAEKEALRKRRSDDWMEISNADVNNLPVPSAPPASLFHRNDLFPNEQKDNMSVENKSEEEHSDSDVALNPIGQNGNQQIPSSLYLSPARQQMTATAVKTPEHAGTSFFPRTTPTSGSTTNLHITSPVAKSRVASSTLKLRRFSREHEVSQTLTSTVRQTPRTHQQGTPDYSIGDATDKKEKKSKSMSGVSSDENEAPNHIETAKPKRNRRERLSLGDHFRELVTGDANIRVRDHLFDLELPSVPICPSPRQHSPPSYRVTRSTYEARKAAFDGSRKSEVDASNITTRSRRSSRNRADHTG
jgi:hypothetical protein